MTEANRVLGRRAFARYVAETTVGCGPKRTVGVAITTVAASTRARASSPISVRVRLKGLTTIPRATSAPVRCSTIFAVLPCIETYGRTTSFLTASDTQSAYASRINCGFLLTGPWLGAIIVGERALTFST